jgi:hypothetical protein
MHKGNYQAYAKIAHEKRCFTTLMQSGRFSSVAREQAALLSAYFLDMKD